MIVERYHRVGLLLLCWATLTFPLNLHSALANGGSSLESISSDSMALYLRRGSDPELERFKWTSESDANRLIRSLDSPLGHTLYFAPGTYTIRSGLVISGKTNFHLKAVGRVQLVFPQNPTEEEVLLTRDVNKGDRWIEVGDTSTLRAGTRYQIFPSPLNPQRLLEFVIESIEASRIQVTRPVRFMPHVQAIPKGSKVVEELNFIRLHNSDNVSIEGFEFDGRNVGVVGGHTIYSGILGMNRYKAGVQARPHVNGTRISNNRFRNLRGRGIAVYSSANLRISNNSFENVEKEALEVDHYSQAMVFDNTFSNVGLGVVLNDAFSTRVEGNVIHNAQTTGIYLFSLLEGPLINSGHLVTHNCISGKGAIGIRAGDGTTGNLITQNAIGSYRTPTSLAEGNIGQANLSDPTLDCNKWGSAP